MRPDKFLSRTTRPGRPGSTARLDQFGPIAVEARPSCPSSSSSGTGTRDHGRAGQALGAGAHEGALLAGSVGLPYQGWTARRRDGRGGTLADPLPEGLLLAIRADYAASPVPRDLP